MEGWRFESEIFSRTCRRLFGKPLTGKILIRSLGMSVAMSGLISSDLLADQTRSDVEDISIHETVPAASVVAEDPAATVSKGSLPETKAPTAQAGRRESISDEPSGLSNKTLLGIGGAAVLLGVVAAGGSSSSSSSNGDNKNSETQGASGSTQTSTGNQPVPPTHAQMVGVWHASAHSVESKHYAGTYTLFSNGQHQYSIVGETGIHKTGNGHWDLNQYRLSLHNDSGTTYSGEFRDGNYSRLTLGTTVGWVLTLQK